MQTLYHWTSKENADKIRDSDIIRMSQAGFKATDAVYGTGVYLTDLGPCSSADDLKTLWGGQAPSYKIEVCIEVKVPARKLKSCRDHVYKFCESVRYSWASATTHDVTSSAENAAFFFAFGAAALVAILASQR